MPDEQGDAAATPEGAEAAPEGGAGKTKEAKEKRAGEKGTGGEKLRRSHAYRAMASIRDARKGQREVSEPAARAQFLLAEANVLALLDVADALAGGSGNTEQAEAGETAASD